MFERLSKWLHSRKGFCGYAPAEHPDLKQGMFWCRHCRKMRLAKPQISDAALKNMLR